MLVFPLIENETEKQKQDRILSLEKSIETSQSFASFRDSRVQDSASSFELNTIIDPLKIESMVIICQPNSCSYELISLDSSMINIYIENGIYVFLWNYRGYSRSQGSPSMSVRLFLII